LVIASFLALLISKLLSLPFNHTVAPSIRPLLYITNNKMRSFYATAAFAAAASAQYELQSTFAGETFFDNFVFFNSWGENAVKQNAPLRHLRHWLTGSLHQQKIRL